MTHYETGERYCESIKNLKEGATYFNKDTGVCITFFGHRNKVLAMVEDYKKADHETIEWMEGTTSFKKINAFASKYGLQFTDINKM